MKRGLLVLLVLLMALAIAGQADAAAGYRSGIVLFPYAGYSNTDSTWATTVGDITNWFNWQTHSMREGANGFGYAVSVKNEDADVDSIEILGYASPNRYGLAVMDSSEITGSTDNSTAAKVYTSSDTYGFYPYRIIAARVWGDAAGSATQTITLTVRWWTYNTITAKFIEYHEYDVDVSFAE